MASTPSESVYLQFASGDETSASYCDCVSVTLSSFTSTPDTEATLKPSSGLIASLSGTTVIVIVYFPVFPSEAVKLKTSWFPSIEILASTPSESVYLQFASGDETSASYCDCVRVTLSSFTSTPDTEVSLKPSSGLIALISPQAHKLTDKTTKSIKNDIFFIFLS